METQAKFEGEFLNDKKQGQCTINFGNYGKFEGELDEEEKFTNYGKFEIPLQHMKYEGQFKDGLFNGEGKITHDDTGNIYEGEFLDH